MSGEGLHRNAAIETAKDVVKELRFSRFGEARRLLDVAREQIDAAEAAQRRGEEESR